MPISIKNDSIELSIDRPHEGYRFSRFDWTGKITSVKFKGQEFASIERTDASDLNTYGRGFYNEFGIDQPIGFDEIGLGEQFQKIGIGLLKKEHPDYEFFRPHEIEPAKFEVNSDGKEIIIRCISKNHNGYAYELSKLIQLEEDGFSLKYELSNTGIKPIQTTEYGHNFMSLGNTLIDSNYELIFPFTLDQSSFDEFVNPDDCMKINDSSIGFECTPKEAFFISLINGNRAVPASWQIEHKELGLSLAETCDFKTIKINLWGCAHVISPELFREINLQPGKSDSWTRTYSFSEL